MTSRIGDPLTAEEQSSYRIGRWVALAVGLVVLELSIYHLDALNQHEKNGEQVVLIKVLADLYQWGGRWAVFGIEFLFSLLAFAISWRSHLIVKNDPANDSEKNYQKPSHAQSKRTNHWQVVSFVLVAIIDFVYLVYVTSISIPVVTRQGDTISASFPLWLWQVDAVLVFLLAYQTFKLSKIDGGQWHSKLVRIGWVFSVLLPISLIQFHSGSAVVTETTFQHSSFIETYLLGNVEIEYSQCRVISAVTDDDGDVDIFFDLHDKKRSPRVSADQILLAILPDLEKRIEEYKIPYNSGPLERIRK